MGFFSITSDIDQDESTLVTSNTDTPNMADTADSAMPPPILLLPPEVLHHILSFLDCHHLCSLRRTCRRFKALAEEDLLWANLLRQVVPESDFPSQPYPAPTHRQLYMAHHPYWFLPKSKVWISDEQHVGKFMLCRFDPRRGCIEGYRLLAERGSATGLHWSYKPSVVIHNFAPRVHIWLDDPILSLPVDDQTLNVHRDWREHEHKMVVGRDGYRTPASFFPARDIPSKYQSLNMHLWPPRTIPDMPRVRTVSQEKFRGKGHKPQRHDEISQTTFRLRSWSQFTHGLIHFGVRVGEEISTWSTLDPALYTPTKEKPYQGIFVGDYAGHGCEFLLVLQTDRAPLPPIRTGPSEYSRAYVTAMEEELLDDDVQGVSDGGHTIYGSSSMPFSSQQAVKPNLDDDVAHRGSIEAIKLTGDPHIPRGEHTFIADDIGPGGFIRIAAEHPFTGARVVKSRGHVADRGFIDDEFIPSQLIMISPNRLAQYWVPFGHISFYERIDIDDLLSSTRGTAAGFEKHKPGVNYTQA